MKAIAFGNIATESRETQLPNWSKFLGDMEKSIGMPVEFFYTPTYGELIDAMRHNRIQIAHFGPAAALKAVDTAGGEIAIRTSYKSGPDGYYGLLLVRKDSPLKSIEDVIARPGRLTLGIGDPDSTSGALLPNRFAWQEHGIDIARHFRVVECNTHEANMLAVVDGRLDVVTGNTVDEGRLARRDPEIHAQLRVIWRSPIVLPDPIVWRKDLAQPIKDKAAAFLLAYGREKPGKDAEQLHREQEILDRINWWHFKPSDNSQLDLIREIERARRV